MPLHNYDAIDALRWVKFPVLSDGFVCLVDVMGSDDAVVEAARVSYGNDKRNAQWDEIMKKCPPGTTPEQIMEKSDAKDAKLIRYLMANRHTTPFEMAEVKLLVRVPMDTWRQWIRHRTANVNEYSTRYAEAIDSRDVTSKDQWRTQSGTNKQGSGEFLTPGIGSILSDGEKRLHELSDSIYKERLSFGVAREQARKDLPLSTYTEAYWKCDLHNILHFLGLRMDPHAQKEIRDYATIIGDEIIAKLFPVTWQAFLDYRVNAMNLSAMEIEAIKSLDWSLFQGRERDAILAKLKRLGIFEH